MNKALMMTAVLAVSTLCAGVAVNGSLVHDYLFAGENQLIEYHKEVAPGETLWNICAEIATDKEDLSRLVWQAQKDNHITDPGQLQPGRVVIVRVKAARQ